MIAPARNPTERSRRIFCGYFENENIDRRKQEEFLFWHYIEMRSLLHWSVVNEERQIEVLINVLSVVS